MSQEDNAFGAVTVTNALSLIGIDRQTPTPPLPSIIAMSKVAKKQLRSSRKVTDFFQRTSSLSSIPSSPLSVPSGSQNATTTVRSTKVSAGGLKTSQSQKKQPEASSSSPDSPVILTPEAVARTRVSTSHSQAETDAVIVLSDSDKLMPKKKATMSKVKVEDPAPPRKRGFRPRTVAPSAPSVAKTTVRRRNLDPPVTRSSGPSVLQLAKTRSSLKRKHDNDHETPEDNNLFPDEPPSRRTRSTTSLSRLSTLTSSSAPLTPRKSNIPTPPEKALRNDHPSPPKKARRNSPTRNRKAALSRQSTAEVVPSSQSDEEELILTQVPEVSTTEVMQSVDKWRRDSSVVATQGSSVSVLSTQDKQDEIPPSESDFIDLEMFPDTTPMDIDEELEYADPLPSLDSDIVPCSDPLDDVITSLLSSEDEVKSHLEAVGDSSSPLDSPSRLASKPTNQRTPEQPSQIAETSKGISTIEEDVPMEDAFRIRTPSPIPEFLMSPTKTPIPRNAQNRTEQILADIRARAMAMACDSDEERAPLKLKDILDSDGSSSDGELEDNLFKKLDEGQSKKAKGKGKMLNVATAGLSMRSTSPPTSLEPSRSTSPSPVTVNTNQRYNLRRHSPKEPNAVAGPSTLTLPTKPTRKRKLANPLDALIKEKTTADKKGSGTDALKRAEEAIASGMSSPVSTKRSLLDEMEKEEDSEDEEDEDWGDEEAAMDIVKQGGRLRLKSSSPLEATNADPARQKALGEDSDSDSDSDREEGDGEGRAKEASEPLKEEDFKKILGDKEGVAVGDILKKDQAMKVEKARKKKKKAVKGVLLWERVRPAERETDGDVEMEEQEDSLPALPDSWKGEGKKGKLMDAFRKAVGSGNPHQLSTLLNPDTFHILGADLASPLLEWICDLAFSTSSLPLGSQAFDLICQCFHLFAPAPSSNTVLFNVVVRALSVLDAKPVVLERVGWSPAPNPSKSKPTEEQREAVLLRLTKFVSMYSCAFDDVDLPDLILTLILVGLDPSTKPVVLQEIKSTVEHICSNIADERSEERVADRISEVCKNFEPINKAYVVSFFMRASPISTRIVRWVARSLLLVPEGLSVGSYTSLPSLKPYIDLLSPTVGSKGIFDILGHSDKEEYYDELLCYIEILSAALTDIERYSQKEKSANRGATRTSILDSPSKMRERSDLDMLKRLLDLLHGKIVDTRAAHLDRSRAKAALQQLAFRIHYQRQACLQRGVGGGGKPRRRNLDAYFGTPR